MQTGQARRQGKLESYLREQEGCRLGYCSIGGCPMVIPVLGGGRGGGIVHDAQPASRHNHKPDAMQLFFLLFFSPRVKAQSTVSVKPQGAPAPGS